MRVGELLVGNSQTKGTVEYIKVSQDVNLKAGDVIYLNRPEESIDYLVSIGKLSETEASIKKANFQEGGKQSFVKRILNLPKQK